MPKRGSGQWLRPAFGGPLYQHQWLTCPEPDRRVFLCCASRERTRCGTERRRRLQGGRGGGGEGGKGARLSHSPKEGGARRLWAKSVGRKLCGQACEGVPGPRPRPGCEHPQNKPTALALFRLPTTVAERSRTAAHTPPDLRQALAPWPMPARTRESASQDRAHACRFVRMHGSRRRLGNGDYVLRTCTLGQRSIYSSGMERQTRHRERKNQNQPRPGPSSQGLREDLCCLDKFPPRRKQTTNLFSMRGLLPSHHNRIYTVRH